MKKKYSIDVVDIELFEGKPLYTVCVYRWILFGIISLCETTFFCDDLDKALLMARNYVNKNGEYKNK